jgi:branched-chain amino acid transport system permease protein/urea transport system permease protein
MLIALNAVYAICILVLVASGLAILFGLMRVINFAHGEFMMLGAFIAFWLAQFGAFLWAFAIAPLGVGIGSLAVEAGLIRRFYGRPLETILATWGLSIVIREAMKIAVGPQFRTVDDPLPIALSVLGTTYPAYRLAIIAAAALLLGILVWVMTGTRFGVVTRAVIENPELAASLGINVRRTYRIGFAVGSALAGLAGAMIAPFVPIHPEMGPTFVVNGFLTALVGGPASIAGLGLSAAALGASQTLVAQFWSQTAGSLAIVLVAVILMRLRPRGLLAGR